MIIMCPSVILINTAFERAVESVLMRNKFKEEKFVRVCQTFKLPGGLLCPKMGIMEKSRYPRGLF